MAKNEIVTDLWVHDLLNQAEIHLDAQGSNIRELDEALKSASKRGTGGIGYPEYCGIVDGFVIVIEDKANIQQHIAEDNGIIFDDIKSICDYAVNGALHYGKHIAKNTTYKKIICIGVSGDEKHHRITPVFVDDTEYYRILPDVESFISFSSANIEEYYIREVLKEDTDKEKELADILKDATSLHEDLRNYGNLQDQQKPLVVSGILLALNERKQALLDELKGDEVNTDGTVLSILPLKPPSNVLMSRQRLNATRSYTSLA